MNVGDTASKDMAAAEQQVDVGVFGAMEARFDGQIGAFAYLLFVLLYFPCAATIGAIVREAGAPWAGFVAAWTTGMAYLSASLFYQIATYARHPGGSALIIGILVALFVGVVLGLRHWSRQQAFSDSRAAA